MPYPQYGAITQTNTNGGRTMTTHSYEVRAQHPFTHGVSFLVAYAFQRDRIQNWLGDVEQYQVMTTSGQEGWEWQPANPALPEHRLTAALTWQLPVGRIAPTLPTLRAGRLHPRRLAVHDLASGVLGPPGAFHERQRRQRRPDAG